MPGAAGPHLPRALSPHESTEDTCVTPHPKPRPRRGGPGPLARGTAAQGHGARPGHGPRRRRYRTGHPAHRGRRGAEQPSRRDPVLQGPPLPGRPLGRRESRRLP
ncbi:hypothetical protein SBRY_40563 [Actinacidiphila bryophytorum]|uniref:Uncharacterized protein n=1 Tax=Actinacidiphila bryophytorum TaxID=1436133 RepID=A0A9W4MDA2_9ACTN|nr:hypothetical protein SBRY_40563 [Actinacidiphila bryophytorum]